MADLSSNGALRRDMAQKAPVTPVVQFQPVDLIDLGAQFDQPPLAATTSSENGLAFLWKDMTMNIYTFAGAQPGDPLGIKSEVHIGSAVHLQVAPSALNERITKLAAALASKCGRLSGCLDVFAYGDGPDIITQKVLLNFDRVVQADFQNAEAGFLATSSTTEASVDAGTGPIVHVGSASKFRVFIPVDRFERLPEMWCEVSQRLELQAHRSMVSESLFKRRDSGELTAEVSILMGREGPDHADVPGFLVEPADPDGPWANSILRPGTLELGRLEEAAATSGVDIIMDSAEGSRGPVKFLRTN